MSYEDFKGKRKNGLRTRIQRGQLHQVLGTKYLLTSIISSLINTYSSHQKKNALSPAIFVYGIKIMLLLTSYVRFYLFQFCLLLQVVQIFSGPTIPEGLVNPSYALPPLHQVYWQIIDLYFDSAQWFKGKLKKQY